MIAKLVATAAAALRADARDLGWLALLAGSLPVAVAAAWFGSAPVVAVALAAGYLAELVARCPAKLAALAERSQLGAFERQLGRDAVLVLLVWRTGAGRAQLPLLAAALLARYAVNGAVLLVGEYLLLRRSPPVQTRNVDLGERPLRPSRATRMLAAAGHRWTPLIGVPAAVGVLLDTALHPNGTGGSGLGVAGAAAGLALALAALGTVLAVLAGTRRTGDRAAKLARVRAAVVAYRPEVVLYHSGAPGSAYQVNMWLPVLAGLPRRALVLLRQPGHLPELIPSSVPVVCMPRMTDVMDFEVPSLKVALYVANVGDNLHLIRHAGPAHVFVGHGDSDKAASANRVSRIYDEVWVAGPAGRDRYREAGVCVRDRDIVEVGRPQLAGVERAGRRGGPVFTVLYAPTWEGWSADMDLTSVAAMGERIVTLLLGVPGIRVIYRAHPLTGSRSLPMARAHRSIVRLLAATNRGRSAAGAAPAGQPAAHLVVGAGGPSLYSCFNQADLLVSDVSSVVSDFTASDKPYVITNPQNTPEEEFRAEHTAAAAAYLLSRDCSELPGILAVVRMPEPDPLAARRRQAREYLLGPDAPDATARFHAAVEACLARRGEASGTPANVPPSRDAGTDRPDRKVLEEV